MRSTPLFLVALCVLQLSIVQSATYLVDPDGTGDFPTIQAAVNAAVEDDVIQLSDGTFRGDGNRDIDMPAFPIKIESLNGDPALCTIDCEGTAKAHYRAFVFDAGGVNGSWVYRITIQNGYADVGGAVLLENDSQASFGTCVFSDNYGVQDGGAILCKQYSSVGLSFCTFLDNETAGDGGALALSGLATSDVGASRFEGNVAGGGGGSHLRGRFASQLREHGFHHEYGGRKRWRDRRLRLVLRWG